MAIIKLKINAKVYIEFTEINLLFIRSVDDTQTTSLMYSNATGQIVTAGQILYSSGSLGNIGYLEVKSTSNLTLNGNGAMPISVSHYPSSVASNTAISFNFDSSPIGLNLTYNSLPIVTDVEIDLDNRTERPFDLSDFTSHYSDYDSDSITSIAIFGDVTGYKYNNIDYVAGTYINVGSIGLLTYVPLNQDAYYEKDNTWKAKDSNGNISIT